MHSASGSGGGAPHLRTFGCLSLIAGLAGPGALIAVFGFLAVTRTSPPLDPSVAYYLGLVGGVGCGLALTVGPIVGLVFGFLSLATRTGKAGIVFSVLTLMLLAGLFVLGLIFGPKLDREQGPSPRDAEPQRSALPSHRARTPGPADEAASVPLPPATDI